MPPVRCLEALPSHWICSLKHPAHVGDPLQKASWKTQEKPLLQQCLARSKTRFLKKASNRRQAHRFNQDRRRSSALEISVLACPIDGLCRVRRNKQTSPWTTFLLFFILNIYPRYRFSRIMEIALGRSWSGRAWSGYLSIFGIGYINSNE